VTPWPAREREREPGGKRVRYHGGRANRSAGGPTVRAYLLFLFSRTKIGWLHYCAFNREHRAVAGISTRETSPKIFIEERADPGALSLLLPMNRSVAALGAWVSFDGIGRQPLESHFKPVHAMIGETCQPPAALAGQRLLLGRPVERGEVRNFNYMSDVVMPDLHDGGISEATIRKLRVENSAKCICYSF
jgi:hypothetical protein